MDIPPDTLKEAANGGMVTTSIDANERPDVGPSTAGVWLRRWAAAILLVTAGLASGLGVSTFQASA